MLPTAEAEQPGDVGASENSDGVGDPRGNTEEYTEGVGDGLKERMQTGQANPDATLGRGCERSLILEEVRQMRCSDPEGSSRPRTRKTQGKMSLHRTVTPAIALFFGLAPWEDMPWKDDSNIKIYGKRQLMHLVRGPRGSYTQQTVKASDVGGKRIPPWNAESPEPLKTMRLVPNMRDWAYV